MYITTCKTDDQCNGHSKPVHWDNPKGWHGKEDGRGVQDGGTHVHPWLTHVDDGKSHNSVK